VIRAWGFVYRTGAVWVKPTFGRVGESRRGPSLLIDFEGGRTPQLTGVASIDWDPERARSFTGAERVVDFEVGEVIDSPFGF
jgi:uncharacterized protein